MALFTVTRFTGSDVDLGFSQAPDVEKETRLLEALKKKAAERRKRQHEVQNEEAGEKKTKKAKKETREKMTQESSEPVATPQENHVAEPSADSDSTVDELKKGNKEAPGIPKIEGATDVGDFCVLGEYETKQKKKVHRVLPEWLAHPTVVESQIQRQGGLAVSEMERLDPVLKSTLQENGFSHFFPVQAAVLPELLWQLEYGYSVGRGGVPPSDICVSAPTGSGKTLVFVLPIVQALRQRWVVKVRCLAVLPVQDLATQVYQVFHTYAQPFGLKVKLIIGQSTFEKEQRKLVKRRAQGWESQADIVVATPGRLVDHIKKTEGFDLSHLRFLILDEADKMMEEVKQDWLAEVEAAVFEAHRRPGLPPLGGYRPRTRPGPLTPARLDTAEYPLQKLLCSATLSQNPEKLQQLNLFRPKLFTSVVKATPASKPAAKSSDKKMASRKMNNEGGGEGTMLEEGEGSQSKPDGDADAEDGKGEFVGKFTTPSGLKEYFVECNASEKPLVILHYLHTLKFRRVLCFTNTVEAAHRLSLLVKLVGNIEVREFSSNLHAVKRRKILRKFASGKVDLLICSDAMSRGMDVENVKYIISYDAPTYIKTYIHRVGRTARAGKSGMAITLTEKKEIFHFKKMLKDVGKPGVEEMKVTRGTLKPLLPAFQKALEALPDMLQEEKEKKRKGKSRVPLGAQR